jgi:pyruvate,water dikinase
MSVVREGGSEAESAIQPDPLEAVRPQTPVKPMTATEVKVNLSIPEAAERAAATGADGVGLLRMEHIVLSLGKTPEQYIIDHGENAYIEELVDGIQTVAEEFYPRPVRARTLDSPTDEFRELDGGASEPHEHNPMLGYRGIRRSLDNPGPFLCELKAFSRLFEMGYDNVELMLPLVNDAEDIERTTLLMEEVGIDPEKARWGVMIETPANALLIEEIAAIGVEFVWFGTNDLTQYTLAVDRNNEYVVDRFDELHSSVLKLIESTIQTCRELGVDTSICGQAALTTRSNGGALRSVTLTSDGSAVILAQAIAVLCSGVRPRGGRRPEREGHDGVAVEQPQHGVGGVADVPLVARIQVQAREDTLCGGQTERDDQGVCVLRRLDGQAVVGP